MALPLTQRPFDLVCAIYFLTHIPITIFVDSQSLFPAEWYPAWARDALQWHIKTNGDHLVRDNPAWFVALVFCEVLLQIPCFFIAAYGIIKARNWVRIPLLIYSVHVATTMVPILGDILYGPKAGEERFMLAAIYSPYLLLPLAMAFKMALNERPFGAPAAKAKRG